MLFFKAMPLSTPDQKRTCGGQNSPPGCHEPKMGWSQMSEVAGFSTTTCPPFMRWIKKTSSMNSRKTFSRRQMRRRSCLVWFSLENAHHAVHGGASQTTFGLLCRTSSKMFARTSGSRRSSPYLISRGHKTPKPWAAKAPEISASPANTSRQWTLPSPPKPVAIHRSWIGSTKTSSAKLQIAPAHAINAKHRQTN